MVLDIQCLRSYLFVYVLSLPLIIELYAGGDPKMIVISWEALRNQALSTRIMYTHALLMERRVSIGIIAAVSIFNTQKWVV